MARNKTIYQSETLYVGPSPATGYHFDLNSDGVADAHTGLVATSAIKQLHRIQNVNYSFTINKKEAYQLGQLAFIDRTVVESPTVNLGFSYYVPNLYNERMLGFVISSGNLCSAVSGILSAVNDEKNYFVKVNAEGADGANNSETGWYCFGIGNASITNYSLEGAVGDYLKASVTAEGQNFKVDYGTNTVPAINPFDGTPLTGRYTLPAGTGSASITAPLNYSVLQPGDINLSLNYNELGADSADWKVQNFAIEVPLARTPINKLGSKFAVSRTLNVPTTIRFRTSVIVGDYKTGNLASMLACGGNGYNATITVQKPACSNSVVTSDTGIAVRFQILNASLDSSDYSLDLNGNKTANLNFTVPISASQDVTNGFFMSGIN